LYEPHSDDVSCEYLQRRGSGAVSALSTGITIRARTETRIKNSEKTRKRQRIAVYPQPS
jgi:hypothetical protein